MQYLQSAPFTVGLGNKRFSEGWDRIFGKKDEVEPCPETERSGPVTTPAPIPDEVAQAAQGVGAGSEVHVT
jgi:hypothetical protein